jgi:hypothetical protein
MVRILEARQLAPRRIRMFKLSRSEIRGEAQVGRYVDPPARGVVLSVDKSFDRHVAQASKGED